MSSLSSISGTKLSQHTHTSSPTGTKLSQHTQNCPFQSVLPEQGELCTALTPMPPSRENFVPLSPSRCPAGRTLYRAQRQTRYKTLPAQPVRRPNRYKTLPTRPHQQPNRYKTLPTRPKLPISARFTRAGRTLYRSHHHDPSRENFLPHPAPNPVQNSPNTPKIADFSPFYPSRENFVPLPPPCPPAGRTLYRFHPHDPQQGELCTAPRANPGTKLSLLSRSRRSPGTKLSPLTHTSSPPGTKLSPHTHKGPFQPVLPEQGELCTALTPTPPSRENFVPLSPSRCPAGRTLYRAQRQTRYKTPPTRTVPHPCRE